MLTRIPTNITPLPQGALGPVLVVTDWRPDIVTILSLFKASDPYVREAPRASLLSEVQGGIATRTLPDIPSVNTLDDRRALRYDPGLADTKLRKKDAADSAAADILMAQSEAAYSAMVSASDIFAQTVPVRFNSAAGWGSIVEPLLTEAPPKQWFPDAKCPWTLALKRFAWGQAVQNLISSKYVEIGLRRDAKNDLETTIEMRILSAQERLAVARTAFEIAFFAAHAAPLLALIDFGPTWDEYVRTTGLSESGEKVLRERITYMLNYPVPPIMAAALRSQGHLKQSTPWGMIDTFRIGPDPSLPDAFQTSTLKIHATNKARQAIQTFDQYDILTLLESSLATIDGIQRAYGVHISEATSKLGLVKWDSPSRIPDPIFEPPIIYWTGRGRSPSSRDPVVLSRTLRCLGAWTLHSKYRGAAVAWGSDKWGQMAVLSLAEDVVNARSFVEPLAKDMAVKFLLPDDAADPTARKRKFTIEHFRPETEYTGDAELIPTDIAIICDLLRTLEPDLRREAADKPARFEHLFGKDAAGAIDFTAPIAPMCFILIRQPGEVALELPCHLPTAIAFHDRLSKWIFTPIIGNYLRDGDAPAITDTTPITLDDVQFKLA